MHSFPSANSDISQSIRNVLHASTDDLLANRFSIIYGPGSNQAQAGVNGAKVRKEGVSRISGWLEWILVRSSRISGRFLVTFTSLHPAVNSPGKGVSSMLVSNVES